MVISFILNMMRSAQRIVVAPKAATAGEAEEAGGRCEAPYGMAEGPTGSERSGEAQ